MPRTATFAQSEVTGRLLALPTLLGRHRAVTLWSGRYRARRFLPPLQVLGKRGFGGGAKGGGQGIVGRRLAPIGRLPAPSRVNAQGESGPEFVGGYVCEVDAHDIPGNLGIAHHGFAREDGHPFEKPVDGVARIGDRDARSPQPDCEGTDGAKHDLLTAPRPDSYPAEGPSASGAPEVRSRGPLCHR
jgi:hypothetical protein